MTPPTQEVTDRRTYALDQAALEATNSACTRRQVGAVILDPGGTIIGRGHNTRAGICTREQYTYAQVPGLSHYGPGPGRCDATHAEIAAITNAGTDLTGCTIAVTYTPCPGCAAAIEAAGIYTVWHPEEDGAPVEQWEVTTPAQVYAREGK